MNLLTERLRIRDLKASDAALLAGIWSDAEVTRYMGGPRDYEETRQDLIYVFSRKDWGNGYASEAARGLCRYAFEHLGLRSLIALIDPENRASARVAEKAGMRFWKETIRPTGKRMQVYLKEPG